MPVSRKIRVVVVDDSSLMRAILKEILSQAADIEVVGIAGDPYQAREVIREQNPDVVTLDVEMPRMNGLDFLEKLMRLKPTPVVMVSSLTEAGSDITVRALELGAVDFVAKPQVDLAGGMQAYAGMLVDKIRTAANARVRRLVTRPAPSAPVGEKPAPVLRSTEKIIALGASTGGTEALKEVLSALPADAPAILITQHMPERFTTSFAKRLDSLCRVHVREATDGERVLPGHAYLAPGHSHLELARSGANYVCRLHQGAPVNRHRPSVDVLFDSVARVAGLNAVAALLTGMGADGAQGLLHVREAGGRTVAQDEASCVVYGMPREAVNLGAAELVLPLGEIAVQLLAWTHGKEKAFRI